MLTALAAGLLLGLVAGLAPGPLMALVLAHSLRHGAREGCKIALAPLATDAPIIVMAWFLAAQAAEVRLVLSLLSVAGGTFVLYLAVDLFRSQPATTVDALEAPNSWARGVLTNVLSPHPWLFWMTAGAATLAGALATGWAAAALFLGAFYLVLVGVKLVLALAAGRLRPVLNGRAHRLMLRILSVLLAGFAVLLWLEGWRQFP
jgi:threonine/homoserine/homoserine lactone efflux protein